MANTIIIKTEGAGDSATTEPTDSDIVKGELAVNTQGGLLFHGNSSNNVARFKATTLAGTNYSLFTVSGGNVAEIAPGTDGHVLTATGTGSIPAWEAAAGGGVSLGSTSSTAHRGDHGVSAYNSGATRYTHPTSAGNKHVPTGGSSGQFLKYSSSGTAVWAADNNTTYSVTDGQLSEINFTSADHTKLNGIAASANNYSHSTNANLTGDVTSSGNATTIATDAVDIAMLSASGTASSSTFLRGDNSWVTPTDTNTTYSVGAGGLTQQNFTTTLKNKLDGVAASANNYSHSTNANLTGDVTSSGNATTIATDAVDIAMLSATGTASSSTFLRGDNSWASASVGDNSVDSAAYVDGSIDTAHYADNSITGVKIKEHVFICTAGITNVGTSSSERHFSFTSTSGNTGTFLGNHAFVVPYECKLIKAFAVFDEVISDGSNMTTFRIQKASQDSTSYSDHYKFTELLIDPHTGMTSFTNTGAGSAFDLLGDMGHTINTGSIGEQSFLEGDKLLAGITVNSGAASGGTRGSVTWVFKSTGGIT
jgi:hypothetical protein